MYEPEPIEPFIQHVATESWNIFKSDAVLYILASLLLAVGAVLSLGIVIGPLTVGFFNIVHARQNGQAASTGDLFSGFDKFVPSLFASFLIFLMVVIGSMCLVVPGLIVALFASFALHAVAFEDAAAIDALKRSFQLVKDNIVNTIVLLIALSVVHAVGGVLIFGFLLASPLTLIATVVAYKRIAMPRAQTLVTPSPSSF